MAPILLSVKSLQINWPECIICLVNHTRTLQAYHEMADFLIKQSTMLTTKQTRLKPPEDLEEQLCRPIKKLKGLVQGAALTEQVDSLVSFCSSKEEQVCMAYEIARHWAHPIPACMSDLLERWCCKLTMCKMPSTILVETISCLLL